MRCQEKTKERKRNYSPKCNLKKISCSVHESKRAIIAESNQIKWANLCVEIDYCTFNKLHIEKFPTIFFCSNCKDDSSKFSNADEIVCLASSSIAQFCCCCRYAEQQTRFSSNGQQHLLFFCTSISFRFFLSFNKRNPSGYLHKC